MTPGRVLVTGGAGFIGSTLVDRLLAAGIAVDVVDDLSTGSLANLAEARADRNHLFKFHHHDVGEPSVAELVAQRAPEVVFHLAARPDLGRTTARVDLDARVDVLGSLHVIEGARAGGARKIVYASSGTVLYGEPAPSDLPSREAALGPRSLQGLGKRTVVDYLAMYRELHQLEFTALVLSSVYGPRQGPDGEAGIVLSLASELLAGDPGSVPGDGQQSRDLLFVDDAVDAFVRAAGRGSGLVCNVGTGRATTMLELHRTMADAVGSATTPRLGDPDLEGPARSALDPGRAAIHLGWKPYTPLEDGVREVLRWCRELNRGRT